MSEHAGSAGAPLWSAEEISAAAAAMSERVVELRRKIHSRPELGLENPITQALVVAALERAGIDGVRRGNDCTWVTADIHGTADGPGKGRCVALRSDTDALPLDEHGDEPFASSIDGRMHACGHDGHVAMLVGAAELLHANRHRFAGTVRVLFQPGEEGFGGARIMIDAGALEGVSAAFAIHLQPSADPHVVAWRAGAFLAAFDDFSVVFRGAGGHASSPHSTRDPVPAIGPLVDGLSHVVARETDPDDRVVISVTQVRAGTKENVIPPSVECGGTIRSISRAGGERAREQLERVAVGIAHARGLEVDVEVRPGYPPTVNDEGVVKRVAGVAGELGLVTAHMPSTYMGAEDFSYVLERVPGAMVFLGCGVEGGGPLHSDRMKIDESVLSSGVALHTLVSLQLLAGKVV